HDWLCAGQKLLEVEVYACRCPVWFLGKRATDIVRPADFLAIYQNDCEDELFLLIQSVKDLVPSHGDCVASVDTTLDLNVPRLRECAFDRGWGLTRNIPAAFLG